MIHRLNLFILGAIFILGLYLRIQFLPQQTLTFGYDQARDAIQALTIAKGDLKILGPSASTPGLYHGVFYYYLLAPAYWLGGGSPIVAACWIAFLNALSIFLVYLLTLYFTKKKGFALTASVLFAVSFEANQYATWLSNPTIGIWTVPLIYLGLWVWTEEKKGSWGPFLTALGLALSIQAEIFLAYHLVPIAIWLIARGKRISVGEWFKAVVVLCLGLSSMLAVEVKFGFRSLEGIKLLMMGSEGNLAYAKSLGDYLVLYLNQIGRIFAFNTYPGNIGYGGALVIVSIVYLWFKDRKNEPWVLLLTLWLFSHLWVVTVGGTSTPFLMVGIGPAVAILLGIVLGKIFEGNRVIALVVLALVVYGNLNFIYRENPKGSTLFAIQKDMLLSKQLALLDYTYQSSNSSDGFTINTLTSPLWINLVWSYLYQWYGQSRYGYLPGFAGHDQVGQIQSLPQSEAIKARHYLILEPMGGIPTRYLEETVATENARSVLQETQLWGELTVEKRRPLLN